MSHRLEERVRREKAAERHLFGLVVGSGAMLIALGTFWGVGGTEAVKVILNAPKRDVAAGPEVVREQQDVAVHQSPAATETDPVSEDATGAQALSLLSRDPVAEPPPIPSPDPDAQASSLLSSDPVAEPPPLPSPVPDAQASSLLSSDPVAEPPPLPSPDFDAQPLPVVISGQRDPAPDDAVEQHAATQAAPPGASAPPAVVNETAVISRADNRFAPSAPDPAEAKERSEIEALVRTAREDAEPRKRGAAISSLVRRQFEGIVPLLQETVTEIDPRLESVVTTALDQAARLNDTKARLAVLCAAAGHPSPRVRQRAVYLVSKVGWNRGTRELLVERARVEGDRSVQSAILTAGDTGLRSGDASFGAVLTTLLEFGLPATRKAVLGKLRAADDRSVAAAVAHCASEDGETGVRAMALRLLLDWQAAEALDVLRSWSRSRDAVHRRSAVDHLLRSFPGDRRARGVLYGLRNDRDETIRRRVRSFLQRGERRR